MVTMKSESVRSQDPMSDPDLTRLHSMLVGLAPQGRAALLPALHLSQQLHGWIPEAVAAEVGRVLGVPLADVHGVIDFYEMLSRQPIGRIVVRVCSAPVCALAGADGLADALCGYLKLELGQVSADGEFTVEHAPCLGLCDHAPALLVGEVAMGRAAPEQAAEICARKIETPISFVGGDIRILTSNCGQGHFTSLAKYSSGGGYVGLKKALLMPAQDVLAEVKAAGLVGRGGAAF